MQRLQLPFTYEAPNVDESFEHDETATEIVLKLAERKVQAIATTHSNALLIGADQVAVINNEILTKPGDHESAKNQLRKINGKSVVFFTGLCLLNTCSNKLQKDCFLYTVSFRQLSEAEMERYLLKEQPYDCAGSFKSENYGISLIKRMEGADPTSLIGLPLIGLAEMLRNEHQQIP